MLNGMNEEDRRTYERSARLILLLAVRDVMPGAHVRFEHSIGMGIYLNVTGGQLDRVKVQKIEERMHEIVRENAPIVRERWTKEDAIRYFTEQGQEDTVRLLHYRKYEFFNIYTCKGYCEYFYGDMASSTGEIASFGLHFCYPGMILLLPATDLQGSPAPLVQRPRLMQAYADANKESALLSCMNTADLDDILMKGGAKDFIRVCEALQARHLSAIAEMIVQRGARVVFIAGPSSSGKTTFAHRLSIQLMASGKRPVAVSMDNYYLPHGKGPVGADGKPDYECPEALNIPLFNEQLEALLAGEEVELPVYDFKTGMPKEKGTPVRLGEKDILIVEGIHGLNEAFSEHIPSSLKFRIFVSALTQLNLDDHNRIRTTDIRLLRRMVRDYRTRGSSVDETMDMWNSVRRGEELYIFPHQENADVFFNTSLLYEISILKKYAFPLLKSVPEENCWYRRSQRLLKFLNYFVDCTDESEIPPTSILREFVGGCSFYDE